MSRSRSGDAGPSGDPVAALGQIDIYLLDQVMRGRIAPGDAILDGGCGHGRNLEYFLGTGYEVFAVDADADAVTAVVELAARLAPSLSRDHFLVEPLEAMSLGDGSVDVVVCSAVLHFARDEAQFEAMLDGAWRVLRSGGVFFARLASSIGIETRVRPRGDGRHDLPDGTTRYLVDERRLLAETRRRGGRLLDPIKTTVVQDQRAMTTWVARKD